MAVHTLPLSYELVVYSGTTFVKEFRWLPEGAEPVDFTNWTASLLMGPAQASLPTLIMTESNGGITLTTSGQIVLKLTATQTAALKAGQLNYSLDLTDPDGTVTRFLRGRTTVVVDVGRAGP